MGFWHMLAAGLFAWFVAAIVIGLLIGPMLRFVDRGQDYLDEDEGRIYAEQNRVRPATAATRQPRRVFIHFR